MARKACGRVTHCNGTHGMRGMLTRRNAWYASVVQYKVQCGHADSSEWNVIHYANNAMLTDRPCVPPLPPYGAQDGRVRV